MMFIRTKSVRLSRRMMLGAGAAIATAVPAFAQAPACRIGLPPREKGARVWMDMDQVELDADYDQSF
jgi:hypothetical protein